ncbi:MAG: DUF1631 family protein [Pseudomonadales bacterium]
MDWQFDATQVFAGMHHRVTGELLHLMDGLFSNIEDGLFELAFRTDNDDQKRRCFDLMREMRFQRSRVVQSFAKRTQTAFDGWLRSPGEDAATAAFNPRATRMAQKCTSHFGGLLQSLAERTAHALGQPVDRTALPISPNQIAGNFIESMRALSFDEHSIEIVEDLFGRFVLERLGSIYGECNQHLQQAGFLTAAESTAARERDLQLAM